MAAQMAAADPTPMFLPHRVLRAVWRWSPVWMMAVLVWQLKSAGMDPALAEQRRLAAAKTQIEAEHAARSADFERLQAEYDAWHDPTYRERRRRALRASRARAKSR